MRRYDRAAKLDQQLETEIIALMKKAEQVDQQETDDGQRLPEQISRRTKLRQQVQQARVALENQVRAKAQAKRPEYERKLAAHRACKDQKRWGGPQRAPKAPREEVKPTDSINLTDPDSHVMRKNLGEGYEQSYNAQATVDADGSMLMLAAHVITAPADFGHLEAGVQKVDPSLGQVKAALADAGYLKAESLAALEQQGVDVYVAVTQEQNRTESRIDLRGFQVKPERTISTPIVQAMRAKLNTTEARKTYRKRWQSVEPVFGIIKSAMGFRQFLLRGLAKVSGEWSLVGLAYNFKRLSRLRQALPA